jgi:hypothetical protein
MWAGHWVVSRGSRSSFLAALGLFGQIKIAVGPKGELVTQGKGRNGQPIKWVEIAPFIWQQENGHWRLAAKVEDGRIVRGSVNVFSPAMVFDRPNMTRDAGWVLPLLYFAMAVLTLTALYWPGAAILRRVYRAPLKLPRAEMRAYRLGKFGAWLMLAAISAWVAALLAMTSDFDKLGPKFDWVLHLCQIFGFVAFFGGVLTALWNLRAVWSGHRRWPARLWSIALVAASLIVLYIAIVFNLIRWAVDY